MDCEDSYGRCRGVFVRVPNVGRGEEAKSSCCLLCLNSLRAYKTGILKLQSSKPTALSQYLTNM